MKRNLIRIDKKEKKNNKRREEYKKKEKEKIGAKQNSIQEDSVETDDTSVGELGVYMYAVSGRSHKPTEKKPMSFLQRG